MPQYVLRVEAVNLAAVLDDTDDLSTRRGGGLMLLYAVRDLNTRLTELKLTPQATGASIGVFTFDAATDEAAEAVAGHVRVYMRDKDSLRRHGTFVVDAVRARASDVETVETAIAANRWRQFREPTVALDGVWETAAGECWQNCVRPAARGKHLPKDPGHEVSLSVLERHLYGKKQRQNFYPELIDVDATFTDEFQEISDRHDLAPHPTHNKLAVFYADGNGFGDLGRKKLAESMDAYRLWSDALQAHHKALLAGLVARAKADREWQNDRKLRLETLLWGGDEILWVVPGWKGWELAEWFFDHPHTVQGQALTYAAGLVFCGTKTPIHNVVKLAHRVADTAKATRRGLHGLAYEVLESFDDVTGDWDAHRRRWLPPNFKSEGDPLTIDPKPPAAFWDALRAIAAAPDFPMRQLFLLAHAWRKNEPDTPTEPHRKRLMASGVTAELDTFLAAFPDPHVGWLHLLQMLPYVAAREGTA